VRELADHLPAEPLLRDQLGVAAQLLVALIVTELEHDALAAIEGCSAAVELELAFADAHQQLAQAERDARLQHAATQ
jgi:hypothetical protein